MSDMAKHVVNTVTEAIWISYIFKKWHEKDSPQNGSTLRLWQNRYNHLCLEQ